MFLVCGCMALQQNLFRIMRFMAGEYKLSNKKVKNVIMLSSKMGDIPHLKCESILGGFFFVLAFFGVRGESVQYFSINLCGCVD